jgi:hypothetical protein
MSPADSTSTSPGTSRRMGTSIRRGPAALAPVAWPAAGASPWARRSTVAVLLTMDLSLSAASWDRLSCQKRRPVESTTMAVMTVAALMSSVAQEIAASTVSSRLNGLR